MLLVILVQVYPHAPSFGTVPCFLLGVGCFKHDQFTSPLSHVLFSFQILNPVNIINLLDKEQHSLECCVHKLWGKIKFFFYILNDHHWHVMQHRFCTLKSIRSANRPTNLCVKKNNAARNFSPNVNYFDLDHPAQNSVLNIHLWHLIA